MSIPALYRPEAPTLAAVKTALQAHVQPASTPIRVDVDAVQGAITSPMCLLEVGQVEHERRAMGQGEFLARVGLVATFIAESIDLARQLRSAAAYHLVGRDGHGAFYSTLTVTGFVVVDRRLTDPVVPPVTAGGGWANTRLPVTVWLEPAS